MFSIDPHVSQVSDWLAAHMIFKCGTFLVCLAMILPGSLLGDTIPLEQVTTRGFVSAELEKPAFSELLQEGLGRVALCCTGELQFRELETLRLLWSVKLPDDGLFEITGDSTTGDVYLWRDSKLLRCDVQSRRIHPIQIEGLSEGASISKVESRAGWLVVSLWGVIVPILKVEPVSGMKYPVLFVRNNEGTSSWSRSAGIWDFTLSKDTDRVWIACSDGFELQFLRKASGPQARSPVPAGGMEENWAMCIAVCEKRSLVAVGTIDGQVEIADSRTLKSLGRFQFRKSTPDELVQRHNITGLVLSADGDWIVAISIGGLVCAGRTSDLKSAKTIEMGLTTLGDLRLIPGRKEFSVLNGSSELAIGNYESGKILAVISGVRAVHWTADGKNAVILTEKRLLRGAVDTLFKAITAQND